MLVYGMRLRLRKLISHCSTVFVTQVRNGDEEVVW